MSPTSQRPVFGVFTGIVNPDSPELSRNDAGKAWPPVGSCVQKVEPDVSIGLDRNRTQTSPLGTTGSTLYCIVTG